MRYDFDQLAPIEFQWVVRDLLKFEWGTNSLETFTEGSDSGIDVRWAGGADDGGDVIVQCKKIKADAYARLKSELKTKELPKVQKLRPSRYVLATSVEMNPTRKQDIMSIMFPWIRKPGDIYGRDELNAGLRDHPEVEQAHVKLWLASAAVAERIFRSEIFLRRQYFRDDVARVRATYVETSSYHDVRRMLAERHVCIVSGDPGIGKSTLATMVAMAYLNHGGWDVVPIVNNMVEAELAWHDNRNQLFYYDDFLGRAALAGTSVAKNEDRRILDLIAAVGKQTNKRLILTTREYILAAARIRHDRLNDERIDINKYVLQPSAYTKWQRARILYNHLHASELDEEAILAFIDNQTYLPVVSHPNYSPRLIGHITTSPQAKQVPASQFPDFTLKVLNHPDELWQKVLDDDLDTQGQAILACLISLPTSVDINELETATESYVKLSDVPPVMTFRQALRVLDGANLIRVSLKDDRTLIAFRDPSVLDFMVNRLANQNAERSRLLRSIVFFEQCAILLDYAHGVPALRRSVGRATQRMTQGIVPLQLDMGLLVAAMNRTLVQAPCYHGRHELSVSTLGQTGDVAERLRMMVDCARRAGSEAAGSITSAAIRSMQDRIGRGDLTPDRLVSLLQVTAYAIGSVRSALDDLGLALAHLLWYELDTPHSYERFLDLAGRWPGLLPPEWRLRLAESFGAILDQWATDGIDIEEAWQAQSVVDSIEVCGRQLQIDVGECVGKLYERWEKTFPTLYEEPEYDRYEEDDGREYEGEERNYEPDYEPGDDDWERGSTSWTTARSEDDAIADLFESLR